MSTWSYNPDTQSTGDSHGLIPRHRLEEAAEMLRTGGIHNRQLIVDVLAILSGLSAGEVKFSVDLCLGEPVSKPLLELPRKKKTIVRSDTRGST